MSRNKKVRRNDTGVTRGSYILGVLFFIAVLVSEFYLIRKVHTVMTDVDGIPVRQIQIKGDLHYLDRQEVEEFFMANPESHNLYTMDLSQVRTYMETMPWISRVTMQKKLPDILSIQITEHKPIAYYNDGILVTDWSVIYPEKAVLPEGTPILSGPEKLARSVYEMYCDVNLFLEKYGFRISELSINESNVWSLKLDNGLPLILGRNDDVGFVTEQNNVFMWRLGNFIEAYPHIENKNTIEYIDLRYDTGIAVKWIDSSGK